nr:GNAT family N-acetyltransferase [Bacteroides intestinalis]
MIDTDEIVLKPLLGEDILWFDRWLRKDYIYKWLCPDGEEQKEAWLDEVNNRDGKYDFMKHFIVYYKDKKSGYLIGEEEYLNRGIGKMIIRKLEEKIIELGGREIAADPSEENVASIKVLLSNGFKKKSDGDYRKII